MAEPLHVTADQAEAIEAAWRLCSNGARRVDAVWSGRFRTCVAQVIGREPPDAFMVVATSYGVQTSDGGQG